MKYSTTLLVLSSFLIVFALALTKPSIAANLEVDASESVLDIDGDELRAGTEYYILPVFRGREGGLIMASTGEELSLAVSNCLPLIFTPENPNEGLIHVSTNLNIKFIASTLYAQSNVWRIQKSSNSEIQWSVSTSGVEGNSGFDTVANWFKIEKSGMDYKLVFVGVNFEV